MSKSGPYTRYFKWMVVYMVLSMIKVLAAFTYAILVLNYDSSNKPGLPAWALIVIMVYSFLGSWFTILIECCADEDPENRWWRSFIFSVLPLLAYSGFTLYIGLLGYGDLAGLICVAAIPHTLHLGVYSWGYYQFCYCSQHARYEPVRLDGLESQIIDDSDEESEDGDQEDNPLLQAFKAQKQLANGSPLAIATTLLGKIDNAPVADDNISSETDPLLPSGSPSLNKSTQPPQGDGNEQGQASDDEAVQNSPTSPSTQLRPNQFGWDEYSIFRFTWLFGLSVVIVLISIAEITFWALKVRDFSRRGEHLPWWFLVFTIMPSLVATLLALVVWTITLRRIRIPKNERSRSIIIAAVITEAVLSVLALVLDLWKESTNSTRSTVKLCLQLVKAVMFCGFVLLSLIAKGDYSGFDEWLNVTMKIMCCI